MPKATCPGGEASVLKTTMGRKVMLCGDRSGYIDKRIRPDCEHGGQTHAIDVASASIGWMDRHIGYIIPIMYYTVNS